MRTRTIILTCMLVLGTGITAQASPLKAEASRYAAASVPTLSVNDFESDKQALYGDLENVLSGITAVENKLISLAIPKDERVWDKLAVAKAEYAYCKDILDAADSEARLTEVNAAIASLQMMVDELQTYAAAFEHEWLDKPIVFADATAKLICINSLHADQNNDGEVSRREASMVTSSSIGTCFQACDMTSFDEFQYFTGVTSIPEYAFFSCGSLTTITLPNSVKTIGANAFGICLQLQTLKMGSKVESIGNSAFSDIPSGTINLTIDCVPGNPVISDVLKGLSALKSVTLGDGITEIGEKAFFGCGGLESVSMTTSVQTIGSNAFGYTSDELSFQIDASSGSKTIADNLFKGVKMKYVTLDDAITGIGVSAFESCDELTEIRIPSHVSVIADAFKGCTHMSQITVSTTLEFIEQDAFENCNNLTLYIEPTATKTTFGGTNSDGTSIMPFPNSLGSIVTVEVMEGVTAIESFVFSSSQSIWQVTLPSTVTEIGSHSFSGSDLVEVVLKDGLKKIGLGAFSGCEKLKSVAVPASVNYIENGAFQGCTSLVEANLPAGLEFVGAQLFKNSGLSHISIPASVTKIWNEAFAGCTDLRDVTLEQDDPTKIEIDDDPFPAPHSKINLNVPFWSVDAYRTDSYWGDFNIVSSAMFTVDNMVYWVNPNTDVPFAILQYPVASSLVTGEVTIPAEITVHGQSFQVTGIASNAFERCYSLHKLTLPYTVTSIPGEAFKDSWALTNVDIKATMEEVDPTAFSGVIAPIITITPYGEQTTVKPDLFKECFAADESFQVVLGEGITGIGAGAFADCPGLKILSVTTDLTTIGSGALTSTSDSQMSFDLTVNPSANSTVVADHLFEVEIVGFKSLSILRLAEGVTGVGVKSFWGCSNKAVYLPESLKMIGEMAFMQNDKLTDVYVKWEEPLDIEGNRYSFYNGNLTFPDEKIRLHVPVGASALYRDHVYWGTYFDIPDDNDQVGDFVYARVPDAENELKVTKYVGASGTSMVNIPESFEKDGITYLVTGIGGNIFENRGDIILTIPTSVKYINDRAFKGCASITVVVKWLEPLSIDPPEFGEYDIRTLEVPVGTTDDYISEGWDTFSTSGQDATIEEYILFADSNVEEACLAKWDGKQEHQFGTKDGLLQVSEAELVTTLDRGTSFPWNSKIKSFDELKYFTNLTTIDRYAFSHCARLERITIPRSVTHLGLDAFWFCASLKTVTLEWDTPIDVDSSNDPFPSKDGITLFVPEGKKSAYQSHPYWRQFFIAEARDGDANGNGGVDINDALAIVNYILGQPSAGFVEANADVNGDGKITIADAVSLVKMILEMP